ncbi:hypothetical protein ACIP2Z_19575 [Streptomyces iakyrus]|uniref:Integral membrane protein n=1 Tax=Streptomyces iakyrus TaxID=68219 RepID=A0ABW8FGQ3_9ACTN
MARGIRRIKWSVVASIILLAIILALSVADWLSGGLRTFWMEHPFLTGSLSSTLFLLLGATLVQDWMARRDESRLRIIILVACGALARAPLAQRRMMWFLANGGTLVEDGDFRGDSSLTSQIRNALARNRIPEASENLVINGTLSAPAVERRLEILARDPEWLSAAYSLLRAVSQGFRAVIARWAPLLAGSDRSAQILIELAQQSDELTRVQVMLLPIARQQADGLSDETIQDLAQAWGKALANAVALDEALTRLSGKRGPEWVCDARSLLCADDVARLRERDARKATRTMRLQI